MSLATAAAVPVQMGFMPESVAIDDPDRPGLLRAGPRVGAPYAAEGVEAHTCAATDCVADGSIQPDLLGCGFDTVDLSGLDDVQAACAEVREAGRVNDEQAATIRAGLVGAVLPTSSGGSIRVLYLADEGFIMRTAGPNRMSLVGPRSSGMNDHGGATSVHADQDVDGTPMAQLMEGRAPELFVHDSPDGHNHDASMVLTNLWIPLQQITQPLVLADGASVDRRRHQLRYGLATDSFLERDDDQVINDIWTFLHDDAQQWYFRSQMDHRSGYVFNTLSTPHGAGVLPGEDVAEWCYRTLESAEVAAATGDVDALVAAVTADGRPELPTAMTATLGEAIDAMTAVLDDATADPAGVFGGRRDDWTAASQTARRRVVRMSLEMRMVCSVEDPGPGR
ncbi:MAG: hypothetical protein ACK4V6_07870, partial [Microthrixaceae bacterium]